jgi:hypothetical protein
MNYRKYIHASANLQFYEMLPLYTCMSAFTRVDRMSTNSCTLRLPLFDMLIRTQPSRKHKIRDDDQRRIERHTNI